MNYDMDPAPPGSTPYRGVSSRAAPIDPFGDNWKGMAQHEEDNWARHMERTPVVPGSTSNHWRGWSEAPDASLYGSEQTPILVDDDSTPPRSIIDLCTQEIPADSQGDGKSPAAGSGDGGAGPGPGGGGPNGDDNGGGSIGSGSRGGSAGGASGGSGRAPSESDANAGDGSAGPEDSDEVDEDPYYYFQVIKEGFPQQSGDIEYYRALTAGTQRKHGKPVSDQIPDTALVRIWRYGDSLRQQLSLDHSLAEFDYVRDWHRLKDTHELESAPRVEVQPDRLKTTLHEVSSDWLKLAEEGRLVLPGAPPVVERQQRQPKGRPKAVPKIAHRIRNRRSSRPPKPRYS